MKAKKLVLAVAAVVGATSLVACTDNDKHVAFNEYWKYDWSSSGEVDETLTYAITFEKGVGMDGVGYTLSYSDGKYTTHLKSTNQGYEYKTSLSLNAVYKYGNEEAVTLPDKVETTVVFSNKTWLPLSSTKTVVSHSPVNGEVAKTSDCYVAYNYTVETLYTDGKAHTTVAYNETEDHKAVTNEHDFEYGKGKYSYLDNEQLLLALRGVPADTASGSVKVHNPFLEATQKIKFSFTENDPTKLTYTLNGTPSTTDFSYREVSVTISDKNPGATQTAWIAATASDTTKNVNRNVMLRLETPLSYSLGTLIYTLTSIQTK